MCAAARDGGPKVLGAENFSQAIGIIHFTILDAPTRGLGGGRYHLLSSSGLVSYQQLLQRGGRSSKMPGSNL